MEDLDALVENAFGIDDRELRSARLDSTLSESKATLVSNSFNASLEIAVTNDGDDDDDGNDIGSVRNDRQVAHL